MLPASCSKVKKKGGHLTAVIALGDHMSWDDTAKQIKLPAVGVYLVGIATEAAGSGATTVKVRLNGIATRAA